MPDGQVIALKALRLGGFVARWLPRQTVTWPLQMEVFAIDRALNQRSADFIRRSQSSSRMGSSSLSRRRSGTPKRDAMSWLRWACEL